MSEVEIVVFDVIVVVLFVVANVVRTDVVVGIAFVCLYDMWEVEIVVFDVIVVVLFVVANFVRTDVVVGIGFVCLYMWEVEIVVFDVIVVLFVGGGDRLVVVDVVFAVIFAPVTFKIVAFSVEAVLIWRYIFSLAIDVSIVDFDVSSGPISLL